MREWAGAAAFSALRAATVLPLMSAASVGSYSAQTISLYALLTADVIINATADATGEVYTRFMTILVLVAQLVVRIASIFTIVGLLASSGSSQDEFLLRYCGVFTVSLFGLILCLFLRVFRVTLASFPSAFPTVLDYWGSTEYCLLLLSHSLLSLLFYYCACRATPPKFSACLRAEKWHRPRSVVLLLSCTVRVPQMRSPPRTRWVRRSSLQRRRTRGVLACDRAPTRQYTQPARTVEPEDAPGDDAVWAPVRDS